MRRQQEVHGTTGAAPTVAEYAEQWLRKVNARRAISTRDNCEGDVRRHITTGTLAGLPLDRVTYEHVEAWLQQMQARRLKLDSILTYRKHLGQIFRWAVKRGLIGANPVEFAELPADIAESAPRITFSVEEAERFVATCQCDDEPWGPFFLTMLLLGMRPGEAAGLRWDRIEWEAGTIHIDRAIKRAKGGRPTTIGTTKTEDTRTVRALPVVLAALQTQQVRQEVARMVAGETWPTDWDGLAFLGTDEERPSLGRPCYSSNIRKQLDRICRDAAVPRVKPYELRHSCASILLHRNVNVTAVADMLGTSERMLRRHYHHLIDPVITAGADAWADILAPAG